MHFLYIIYSKKIDKYYVGETKDLQNRIELHNQHRFRKAFTKSAEDWELELSFKCQLREEALHLEKFIIKLIKQPEILSDILSRK